MKFSVVATVLATVILLSACKKVSSSKELDEIHQLEEAVNANRKAVAGANAKLDVALVNKLGTAYSDFATKYPQSPDTPELIFRAGELYANDLGKMQKAIELYEKIYTTYPDHENAATALFLTGYIYHNSLHDLIKAEKSFKLFIEKYPNHNMVKDAQFELESLGRPVEEIFEQILKKENAQKEKDADPATPTN